MFGGYTGSSEKSNIGEYNENGWTEVSHMKDARRGHSAIQISDRVIILGGKNTRLENKNLPYESLVTIQTSPELQFRDTELWLVEDENPIGRFTGNNFENYYLFPELFLVPNDFCS